MNEQEKYEVIKRLVDENGNKLRAAQKLNLSIRQVNRLIKGYKEKGSCYYPKRKRRNTDQSSGRGGCPLQTP